MRRKGEQKGEEEEREKIAKQSKGGKGEERVGRGEDERVSMRERRAEEKVQERKRREEHERL